MANLELISEFVNTADLEDRRDDLEHGRGLVRWLADHRLVNGPTRASERDAENARAVREALRELLRANNGIDVLIGPEGGFAHEEVAVATASGARLVTLGPRILRSETASPLLAALVLYELGDLSSPPDDA